MAGTKHLIVRDKNGRVYHVTPDHMGAPVQDATLNQTIDDFIAKNRSPMEGVNFALLVDESDVLLRTLGNNGGPPHTRRKGPRPKKK